MLLQAHRGTDPSVLTQRRSRGSFGGTLLQLILLVMLAAIAFQYALRAGLLKEYEPALQPVIDAMQPAVDAVEPLLRSAAQAVQPLVEQVRGYLSE